MESYLWILIIGPVATYTPGATSVPRNRHLSRGFAQVTTFHVAVDAGFSPAMGSQHCISYC